MAVSRIIETTPHLVGVRLVHQAIQPDDEGLRGEHLTRIPAWLLPNRVTVIPKMVATRVSTIFRVKD